MNTAAFRRAEAAAGRPQQIALAGQLRITVRVCMLVIALIVFVPLHYIYRLVHYGSPFPMLFLRLAARICGARVTRIGTPLRRDVFFVANHLSWMDILALAGASVVGAGALNVTANLPALPTAWLGARSVLVLAGIAILLFSLLAAYFSWKDRETLAIAVLMLGMTPIGLSTAEGMARFGPYLSLAQTGRFMQPRLGESGEVLFEGSAASGSSLDFYLDRPALFVAPTAADDLVLDKMNSAHTVFFVIPRNRASYWQDRLTERFHIYHQAAACGSHVVISNHQ